MHLCISTSFASVGGFYAAAVATSVGASNANKLYAAVCTVIVEAAKADCNADTLT